MAQEQIKRIESQRKDSGFLLRIDGQSGSGKGFLGRYAYEWLNTLYPGKVVRRRGSLSIADENIGLSPEAGKIIDQLKAEGFTPQDNNPIAVFQQNHSRGARLLELLSDGSIAQAQTISQDLAEGKIVIQDRSTASSRIVIDYLQFLLIRENSGEELSGENQQILEQLENCRDKYNKIDTETAADMSILLTANPEVVAQRRPDYPEFMAQAEQKALLGYANPNTNWIVVDNSIDGKIPQEFLEPVALCSQTYQERSNLPII